LYSSHLRISAVRTTPTTLASFCRKSGLWAGTRHTYLRTIRSIMTISNDGGSAQVADVGTTTNGVSKPVDEQPKKLHGRAFYESIGSPKFVLAPMVDQSEFVCLTPATLHTPSIINNSRD
jgi:hypothetical protein